MKYYSINVCWKIIPFELNFYRDPIQEFPFHLGRFSISITQPSYKHILSPSTVTPSYSLYCSSCIASPYFLNVEKKFRPLRWQTFFCIVSHGTFNYFCLDANGYNHHRLELHFRPFSLR